MRNGPRVVRIVKTGGQCQRVLRKLRSATTSSTACGEVQELGIRILYRLVIPPSDEGGGTALAVTEGERNRSTD